MIGKLIAIIHLITAIIYSFYAFIFPPIFFYDYLYYVFLIGIQFSWLIFNHECPFSYLYKIIHYKNYKCGETTTLDDFNELTNYISDNNKIKKSYKNDIDYAKLVNDIFSIALILSILIVGYRSKIANIFLIFFVLIFTRFFYQFMNNAIGSQINRYMSNNSYYVLKNKYYKYNIYKFHDEINLIICMITVLFLIYISYKNKKKY
jgi:hypothetical protein